MGSVLQKIARDIRNMYTLGYVPATARTARTEELRRVTVDLIADLKKDSILADIPVLAVTAYAGKGDEQRIRDQRRRSRQPSARARSTQDG